MAAPSADASRPHRTALDTSRPYELSPSSSTRISYSPCKHNLPLPCQTHSTSNCLSQAMGEGVKVERSRPLAAGRSCRTPLEAKPPTSPMPQLHPTTRSRVDAPAPPAGSRDAAAARCPRRARASGERQASACHFSSGRTPAQATAARHCRHRRSVAIAPSRLVRRPVGRAPLSLNVCGRST